MAEITKEPWAKKGMEVMMFNGKKWLNEANVKDQLKQSNLLRAYITKTKDCGNYQPYRGF